MEQQYYEIISNFSPVLNLALALLRGRGFGDVCEVVSSSKISVVNTEYDRWNGGTYGYTVYVSLSVKQYTSFLPDKIAEMEKLMSEALNESIKGNDNDYFNVEIGPSLSKEDIEWKSDTKTKHKKNKKHHDICCNRW